MFMLMSEREREEEGVSVIVERRSSMRRRS